MALSKTANQVKAYPVTGVDTLVFSHQISKTPADVDVSFLNDGDEMVLLRVDNNTDFLRIGPGRGITLNPAGDVYASTASGVGSVTVATGIRYFESGVSSSGGLTPTEIATINNSYSAKELNILQLQQLRLIVEHLRYAFDVRLYERDIPVDSN